MSFLHKLLVKTPYLGKKLQLLDSCGYEPGHYYSPIPDMEDIHLRSEKIFNKNVSSISGIHLNKEKQFELLNSFLNHYKEIPYPFKKPETKLNGFRHIVKGA